MEPEKETGNVEYKLKLLGKTDERIQNLASQMKYRCEEGFGECIYNLGVSDNGTLEGITEDDYTETINTLRGAAASNNYSVSVLTKTPITESKAVYEVFIRENNENKYIDVKVAVAGSVDAGKSSLLGVLTTGQRDNGRGSARLSVFNFPHEVRTGRTSSVAHHILGYDSFGQIVNYAGHVNRMSWPDIVRQSSKIISLFDLAGHEKYLKTTILGLTSSFPDLCLIIIGANRGVLRMTKEHIFLCVTLHIPFVLVITKVDMVGDCRTVMEDTMASIHQILRSPSIRRILVRADTQEDIILCSKQLHTESIVPMFQVSNVTGQGIDNLKSFLNLVGKSPKNTKPPTENVLLHVDQSWSVSGVGTVIGGQLVSGSIKTGDKLWIGPTNGKYDQVAVRSIHCKRVLTQTVSFGSYVCLALKKYDRNLVRKGSVIVSHKNQQVVCHTFVADIKVLQSHSTTIRVGYEPTIHVFNTRQCAKLIKIENKVNSRNPERTMDDDILRTGDTARVTFVFNLYPEYIVPGAQILCCEGLTKVIGKVVHI